MNSRQRRKLAALQHNDAIRLDAWLRENAVYSRPATRIEFRPRRAGKSRINSVLLFGALASMVAL